MRRSVRIIIIVLPIIYGIYFSWFKKENIIIFPESNVEITGYIDDYGEERIATNRYRFRIQSFNGNTVTDGSRLLVVTSPYTNYKYGERLILYGTVEKPADFITDTGKTFDYDNYLKLSNVYGIIRDPEIKILPGFEGNKLKSFLFNIRAKFANSLNKKLNQADATLTRGVLLGEKTGITDSLRENLAKTSTSHIIALSGYNITIVSEIIMKASYGLSIFAKSILGGVGIFVFIILAGGGSSAIRAGIMAGILLYARSRGKNYNALYALAFATSIIVLFTPLSLRYDMGFHLSVLATFGLIVFQNPIAAYFIKKHLPKNFAEILASTLSASIMTMPYIAYNMGIISILGIFANTIVVPLIPPLMLLGFLTAALPAVISIPFIFVTKIISFLILGTVNKIGSISFAAVYKDNISLVPILIIYFVLFYIAFIRLKKSS